MELALIAEEYAMGELIVATSVMNLHTATVIQGQHTGVVMEHALIAEKYAMGELIALMEVMSPLVATVIPPSCISVVMELV